MGRSIAFTIETYKDGEWKIKDEWAHTLLKENNFYPLELLHYIPSNPVYSMANSAEFIAILCGIGNDDELWCEPISQQFGLPLNISIQVLSEYNNTSDTVYGEPICIYLEELLNYNFTKGFTNEKKERLAFSEQVLRFYSLLMNELKTYGSPENIRIIGWFF